MIAGYPEEAGVRTGERVVLRVSTDAPAFRVLFYRCGAHVEPVGRSGRLAGTDTPQQLPFHDWGRPGRGLAGEDRRPAGDGDGAVLGAVDPDDRGFVVHRRVLLIIGVLR